ncbi:hypothetical protein [Arthrobacter agilis]|uniref:hypothetical protein n=1 Tax=Arthrobacter agilis TaxID=37921 RepID=UPI0027D81284|nr:hypothetical protein [Arthrobacter agilis]
MERLIARHVRFGKTPVAAAKWVQEVDEPNGRVIRTTRKRADLIITLEEVAAV